MSKQPILNAAAIPILKPVLAMNLWTFTMWLRMYQQRLPAMSKHNVRPEQAQRPGSLDSLLPAYAQWSAHNYNHLLQGPIQFYTTAFTLALIGSQDKLNVRLAWTYVALRVLHSLVQISYNFVPLRFASFAASTFVSMALTARAAMQVFEA